MKLIGIHGKKGSGKDTVARMVKKHLPTMQLIAYADKLKEVASILSGLDRSYFYDQYKKEVLPEGFTKTPRQYMTEMHDALVPVFGEDVFVRLVKSKWDPGHSGLIVTDVRYDGRETDWIREEGGVILHVYRPNLPVDSDPHSSEVGIQPKLGDYTIFNDGSLFDLERRVIDFLEWWFGPNI